jgi:enhancing lycopene biosynthesis protein 2
MMIEAARIARGEIVNIKDVQPADIDGLVIPGGFGSAKNFTNWAFNGPEGSILPEVKLLLVNLVNVGKPIVGLCVSPVVIAKALQGSKRHPRMTLGNTEKPSPYNIEEMTLGLEKSGVITSYKELKEIEIDKENRIVSAPCYMMEASISDVRKNIRTAIEAMRDIIE